VQFGANSVERKVGAVTILGAQQDKIVAVFLTWNIV
jgi:hypothetical protein